MTRGNRTFLAIQQGQLGHGLHFARAECLAFLLFLLDTRMRMKRHCMPVLSTGCGGRVFNSGEGGQYSRISVSRGSTKVIICHIFGKIF